MTLQAYSARVTYAGPDRLDVTRKTGSDGLFLAPSWRLLAPYKRALEALDRERKTAQAMLDARALEDLDADAARLWARYARGYTEEMRNSYRLNGAAWDALLARERVVLVCYCTDAERCHRAILRAEILPRLGVRDCGELSAADQAKLRICSATERALESRE